MADHGDHDDLLAGFLEQFGAIFEQSKQGVYVFLDDEHAACNDVLAKWQGYKTPKEWAKAARGDFLKLVEPASRHALVQMYQTALKEAIGGQVPVTWLHKDGKTKVKTDTILVPIDAAGHRFALHFISPA